MAAALYLPASLELATHDLRLRPWQPEDAAVLYESANESRGTVGRWLDWLHEDYAPEDSTRWIEHCRTAWMQGEFYAFGLFDSHSRLLGSIGLNGINHQHLNANLGYWVRQSRQGQNIAPAAVRLLARHVLHATALQRLEILACVANQASRRVAEKAGGRFEGIARQGLRLHGEWQDAAVYSLLAADLD